MTTRQNPMAGRYFNDPNFAAAVSNLAGAFAPPSPEEYLLAEKVKGARTTNQALTDLYGMADGNPDMLGGIAAGGWLPTQGFEAMRGGLANERYATDVGAQTELQKQRIASVASMGSTPLTYGQAMPGIDADLAAAIGLPEFAPQSGAALGAPAPPMTDAQVKGDILMGLSPDEQRAIVGDIDLAKVAGADGPVYSSELDAIGQPAYTDPGSKAAADMVSYIDPAGNEGTAVFDPNTQTLVDVATKQALPSGTRTYKLQGGDKSLMTGGTTSNVTDANKVIATAQYGLDRLGQFRTLLEQNPGVLGLPGTIRGFGQDVVAGALEMGAAFGDTEGVMDSVDEVRQLAERVTGSGNYDPAIAQAYSYALEMAYLQAKMQDPGGEVNVKELERILGTFDGGIAGNSQVLANLDVLQGQLNDRIKYGENLKAGAQATPVPLPGASAGGATRLKFDENGNPVQ